MSSVVGLLERVTKVSEDWSIGSVYTDERQELKVIGAGLRDLVEGNEYTLKGHYTTHPKFGRQLDVVVAIPYVKPDRNSIVKYIAKNFKGVGPATADKFISRQLKDAPDQGAALEEIRQQLIDAPWTLDFTGVTKKATFKADEEASPVLAYIHRDLATRLGGMPGVKDRVLKLLAQYLLKLNSDEKKQSLLDPQILQKCWATLVQDPYEPTKMVPGYAFTTADAIGASVNIPRDAPVRLTALVAYALELGCQRGGHVYLTGPQIRTALAKVDARVPAEDAIRYGIEAEMILEDNRFGEQRLYTPKIYEAEVLLARGLANLCRKAAPLTKQSVEEISKKIQETTKKLSPKLKEGLDPSQVEALAGIMTSETRLHTLTAGPGCGKTQLMEILAVVLKHKDFVFCGPTGKSAKVLSNRLSAHGLEANTIHSTLMGSGRGSFRYNADTELEGDILVVDESSMNDVELAEALVAAANANMHVIFLGDDYQLPSIGVGRFLKDLLAIKEADHHRLTKTHRNSGGILDVIEQIRQGRIECEDLPGVKFSHGLGEANERFPVIARKYIDAVSKYGFEHVALLMSMRAGEATSAGWNITYANAVLRDICNPHALKIPGSRLFVGDRILIKDNITVPLAGAGPRTKKTDDDDDTPSFDETRVVNGDTGTILSFTKDDENPRSLMPKHVTMKLDDGRMVDFPGSNIDLVQHSYAMTVHTSQGSEYKKVIAVVTPGHASFINNAMLFTGLSRARDELDINGEDSVLRKVAATPLPDRNSALVARFIEEMEGFDDAEKVMKGEKPEKRIPRNQDPLDKPPAPPVHAPAARWDSDPEEFRSGPRDAFPPLNPPPVRPTVPAPVASKPALPPGSMGSDAGGQLQAAALSRAQRFAAVRREVRDVPIPDRNAMRQRG
jgi:exodeoxyribonuclease V alpha subunit